MQQSVKINKMLLIFVIYIIATFLQSGDTKTWVQFLEEENITYNEEDLDFKPEIISTEHIEVAPK